MDISPWPELSWRIGVEVELLAPTGLTRESLALRLAKDVGGGVTRFFHAQTEPSLAPGVEVFDNLTLGFRVEDGAGHWVASCVDDLTLQDDLRIAAAPVDGWFRVLSDDRRLLNLTKHLGAADGTLLDALVPVAAAFGTEVEHFSEGMMRVRDAAGAPVLLGAPLPGERERPCELVTAPLDADHAQQLDNLLAPAREMGFTVPLESATHLHFDATVLKTPLAIRNLARLWQTWGQTLKVLVRTNPACRQLGDWPPALNTLIEDKAWLGLPWPRARQALEQVGLSKFCDLNLVHLTLDDPDKDTVELRILPGTLDTREITMAAALFEAMLLRAIAPEPVERVARRKFRRRHANGFIRQLGLPQAVEVYWLAEAEGCSV
ncbi:MAG: amidoligase family protein [Myxococcales bacterium]|nr:amidoligase family protein [Myxococcales bacterium]